MTKLYNVFEQWSTGTPARILMLGLDAAGKTHFLYSLVYMPDFWRPVPREVHIGLTC